MFQFLNGTIKIAGTAGAAGTVMKFQFLNGTIKISGIEFFVIKSVTFQFLNGTIKITARRLLHPDGIIVSIPQWYD